jgi:heme-degrading monooxygenase HmoA
LLVRVWQYEVVPGREAEFERVYSSAGDWARLFARSKGFRGTRLYHDVETPAAYLTVDLFEHRDAWARFLEAHRDAYEDLDRRCSALTVSQNELTVRAGVATDTRKITKPGLES